MIGYIDNNLDGMWKPCTEEKFYEIVSSQAVAKTIAAVRAGNKNRKRALPAFIFCGEVDEAAYQTYAEKCRQTGEKLKEEMSRENLIVSRGPKNMLEMLPTRFSREEVMNVRRAQGKSENPTLMLNNWKKRGYIELDETTDEYIKIKGIVVGEKR